MFKQILKKYILIFTFVVSASDLCHGETKLGLGNFKINPETNLELTSTSMTFDNQTGRADFFDDVVVNYGPLRLSAQQLSFIQSKTTNKFNHLTFFASGQIIISNGINFIYGDTADFNGKKNELTIKGNVRLNQNNNTIMGDKLILDLQKGIARIMGSVKTIINSTGTLNDS